MHFWDSVVLQLPSFYTIRIRRRLLRQQRSAVEVPVCQLSTLITVQIDTRNNAMTTEQNFQNSRIDQSEGRIFSSRFQGMEIWTDK